MTVKKRFSIVGREGEDHDARLNAFKEVYLGKRSNTQEISWVLYDKDDERHQKIPMHIQSGDDLPRGAVVVSVDLTELSAYEAKLIRENHRGHDGPLEIPPQSHAIYITAHESVLKPMARALKVTFDKRMDAKESLTSKNQDYGVSVLWDKNPDPSDDRYHVRISGNNHPESPVDGLRRVTTGSGVYPLLKRLSMGMPMAVPGYSKFDDKPMLGDKSKVMSVFAADELGRKITLSAQRSGRKEKGFLERFSWPSGEGQNAITDRVDAILEFERTERARVDAMMKRVTPQARDASGVMDELGLQERKGGVTPTRT